MEDHNLTEVETRESTLEPTYNKTGDLVFESVDMSVETAVECSCGVTFSDRDIAIKHIESKENAAVKHITHYVDGFSVEDVFDLQESVMIDLSYDGEFNGMIPLEVMEAVYEGGYIVTATDTGVKGVDARIWIREDPEGLYE